MKDQIKEALNKAFGCFSHTFPNENQLLVQKCSGEFFKLGHVDYIQVAYGDLDTTSDTKAYFATGTEYFALEDIDLAINVFLQRLHAGLNNGLPQCESGLGRTLEKIAEMQSSKPSNASFLDPVLVDAAFLAFTKNVRPMLSMGELQTIAAFSQYLKTGKKSDIPGYQG